MDYGEHGVIIMPEGWGEALNKAILETKISILHTEYESDETKIEKGQHK